MNGDIKLSAPGGLPGDIWLNGSAAALSEFVFQGRVVGLDGSPRSGVAIAVFERRSLTLDVRLAATTTDARGRYRATFSLPGASSRHAASECCQCCPPAGREPHRCNSDWDIFIRATDSEESESVDSALVCTLEAGAYTADLVLGEGDYMGLSEWERVTAKIDPFLGDTLPKDIPADKLEWLCKRADVFPLHAAMWIQAHRIHFGRTIKAESCYAFLRAGLPANLLGLVRAGEAAWGNALRDAWKRIILSLPGDGSSTARDAEVASQIAAMQEILVDAAVAVPASGVNERVIYDTAGLSEGQQRTLAGLWIANTGTVEDFWTAVAGSILSGEVELLKFTVQAATLVGTHVPTLQALQDKRTLSSFSMADSAEWSLPQWEDLLGDPEPPVEPPEEIPGEDATEKRQNYARTLFNILEDTYPSASVGSSIARDELAMSAPPNTEFVSTFLTNNPGFDIVGSTVGHYLADASSPWTGIETGDQAEARANLETVQRVYRLTPPIGRYATAKVLLEEGITSATQIVGSTRNEFVSRFGPVLPSVDHDADALAGAVWDNAAKKYSMVVGLTSQLVLAKTNADSVTVAMRGSEQFAEAANGLSELETILGNLDYCACEHCRSVFSPAAYLADLLAFLKKRPAEEAEHALEVLLVRRPDLQHILLECANTNTPLPYIDLVNELLEDYLNGGLGETSKQTTWTAAELRLHPEHLDATVYVGTTLTQTVHPWTLPFSLPTVEAQVYLRHLGVERHELMRRAAPVSPADPADAFLNAMAGDVLGLNSVEFDIVAGEHEAEDREYWGYATGEETDNWVDILSGHGEAGDIGELLVRARLELPALRELIAFDFINPTGEITFDWKESCELDDAEIDSLDGAALQRIHRFVRLQRASKIPARMLNVLLRDVLGGVLSETTLRTLADVVRVHARLNIEWDQLATFWANVIDARDYEKEPRALYTRRFLGKDFGAVDLDFVPDGSSLDGDGEITAARLPRVLAGLGIKEREYQILVDSDLATGDFTFANLTALFRSVVFARALRISIEDLARLAGAPNGLTAFNPFASPADTLAFIDQVEAIGNSAFSINELDWLLRHQFEGKDPLDQAAIARSLGELARGLNTIDTEVALLVDPDGQALAKNLPEVLPPPDIEDAVEYALKIVVKDPLLLAEDQTNFIDAKFVGILNTGEAKDTLVNNLHAAYIADVAARRAWLLGKVVGHLRRRALVLDTIAAQFRLPATVAEALVRPVTIAGTIYTVLTDPSGDDPLFEVFRLPFATEPQIAAGLTTTLHANWFAAWTRLAKAALVCERFKLRADQVAWYSGRGSWLDLDALPLDGTDPNVTFASWEGLRRALALRILSRPDELAPAEILGAATLSEAIGILADHAGWDAAAVLDLAESLGYDNDDKAAVAEEVIPERLRILVETSNRLGVALDVLFSWANEAPTMPQTAAIKAATRAKYGEARWPEVAKPLRDAIRERQRDALVDAVISTGLGQTANDVFEHLLIDVEMSACMMTSRIKQAIASVQIFIHRVLLHLETSEVTFDFEAIARWTWMKNYRVWEANRKVFLYPENWIEPELRRDKTPEFEQFEAGLMQGVLDHHRVEKEIGAYLESLARVANLEMIGVHEHTVTGELWLLARTQAKPHEWFVRRRLPSRVWEAWLPVPNGIDSDAAVILMSGGRLHLFWASEEEAAVSENVLKYRHRVSHMERTRDGWGKPTVSRSSDLVTLPTPHDYRLHYYESVNSSGVLLTVLWESPEHVPDQVGFAVSFVFDPIEQHIEKAGNPLGWSQSVELQPLGDGSDALLNIFNAKTDVGVPNEYQFSGQRSVINATYELDENLDEYDPIAAKVMQGSLEVRLFDTPSPGRKSTFVYHANIFSPRRAPELFPVVYDDRKRKYLLEPYYGALPTEANPGAIGGFDSLSYGACPPDTVTSPTQVTTRNQFTQQSDDGLAVHGQNGLQVNAQTIVLGTLDLGGGGDPNLLPPLPKGFMLSMVALYHPYVRLMQEWLATFGLLGLYSPPQEMPFFRQLKSDDPFDDMGLNTLAVPGDKPIEEFDFDFDSPYATYNWEIFYHAPMLIAKKLTTEQRFEEAQAWYHLIFNPIDLVTLPGETDKTKFWRIKPFYKQAAELAKDKFELMLGIGVTNPQEQQDAIEEFSKQVKAWVANPFDPHAVARVRPGVYQRALLRGYFDNLIAWADNLFRQDTIESITEATVLYIIVAQLLGPRPHEVPGPDNDDAKTFAELDAAGLDLDNFSNVMIQLENWVTLPTQTVQKQGCGEAPPVEEWVRVPVITSFWYFCYPPNPELLKYWDILADRLFKIRHCQNIEGVERQLPLFEPPIDPALLVAATAAGVDIRSVLAELDSGLPPYRFRSVHARATAFTGSLRSLGASLLSALEKRDAEELSRIRSGQEVELLARVRDVRRQQIEEIRTSIESLEAAKDVLFDRQTYYLQLVQRGLLNEEQLQFTAGAKAQEHRSKAQMLQLVTTIVSALPQVSFFPPGVSYGGLQLANVMSAVAGGFEYAASEQEYAASRASLTAGFQRRANDWSFQLKQADLETVRMNKDIAAAKIRLEIAERELRNHELQMEHAITVDEYMRSKFSNRELYDWMVGQLSTLYFQTYQLAFDLAKRAERAYRHELAIPTADAPIIKFGYWDSLRKGLLAGERLGHDLERLDLAYMDRDIREFELRKSISLAELNPGQLQALQEGAECIFDIPEVLFDLDHPGHYLRRIRAVRITIPAVVGPYTTMGATLKLESHKTRLKNTSGDYVETPNDDRFVYGFGAGQMIATSTAITDGGLFNLDFRDERYLPFEYAGAISRWKLELPNLVRQFDYRTISDVIIHIDYTARHGGDSFRGLAENSLETQFNSILGEDGPLALVVLVHDAFPNEWEQFFTNQSGNHVLTLPLVKEHFPYFARRHGFQVEQVDFAMLFDSAVATTASFDATLEDIHDEAVAFTHDGLVAFTQEDLLMKASFVADPAGEPATMALTISHAALPTTLLDDTETDFDPTKVLGMAMIVRYTLL